MLPAFQNSRVSNNVSVPHPSLYLPHRHAFTDLEKEARQKGHGQGYGAEVGIQAPYSHPRTMGGCSADPTRTVLSLSCWSREGEGDKQACPCLFTNTPLKVSSVAPPGRTREDRAGASLWGTARGAAGEACVSCGSSHRSRLTPPWKVLLKKWPW